MTARNVIGDSESSQIFEVMAATLPGQPVNLSRKSSDEQSITIQWNEPIENGGSPILDYQVSWDEGTAGSFTSLGSTLNSSEFSPAQKLTTGVTYRFKIRAVNYIGTGPDSNVISLIAAGIPDTPQKPYAYQATQN